MSQSIEPLTSGQLAKFINQKVIVKVACTDHINRLATLVAVDVANEAIRIRYTDSRIEHKLSSDCIQVLLRPLAEMTDEEKEAMPQPYGHAHDYFEMALAVDYFDRIGIDCRNYITSGHALKASDWLKEPRTV